MREMCPHPIGKTRLLHQTIQKRAECKTPTIPCQVESSFSPRLPIFAFLHLSFSINKCSWREATEEVSLAPSGNTPALESEQLCSRKSSRNKSCKYGVNEFRKPNSEPVATRGDEGVWRTPNERTKTRLKMEAFNASGKPEMDSSARCDAREQMRRKRVETRCRKGAK